MKLGDDGLPEDRVTCEQCLNGEARRSWCKAFKGTTIPTLMRRCVKFLPLRADPDQRTGEERWPGILAQIEEIRALEKAARA